MEAHVGRIMENHVAHVFMDTLEDVVRFRLDLIQQVLKSFLCSQQVAIKTKMHE